jgi:cell division protein FtsI (penicillin-binding protein 3)
MKRRRGQVDGSRSFRWRAGLVFALLAAAATGLLWRAVNLQLVNHNFLTNQGDARFTRVVRITAHRGMITDRYGEPLAVSTPVDSIWVNPKQIVAAPGGIRRLAAALHLDPRMLGQRVTHNLDRDFLYVSRHHPPAEALKVKALGIPGVYLMREYQRYYPAGEVTGQLVGFTDVDDAGQAGVELEFDHWLAGADGEKRVIQDGYGRVIQDVESIRPARPGRDLVLSIDLRLQYLAYRELKRAVQDQHARAGSLVLIDVRTGEVLAMVSQPAFNPNDRDQMQPARYRNRAVTDLFEPGSSIKPFFIAAGLASGKYTERSVVDTSPGYIKVGEKTFEDEHDLGRVDLATILAKSSNVGMAHIALSLAPQRIWTTLAGVGFGRVTASGFPGESAGELSDYVHWRPIGIATMSHGYGISVTLLQLAHAYATIGSYGIARPISLLRVDRPPAGARVVSAQVSSELIHLLRAVVIDPGATGKLAAIPGYEVAGKTGTAWIASDGGYSTHLYRSVFAGVAPASDPRLAAAVVIDEPMSGEYYGGQVAAPVFSAVVGSALRLLGVPPDEAVGVPATEQAASGGPAMSAGRGYSTGRAYASVARR